MHDIGELVGYARVSTPEQDITMQVDALRRAGCRVIFEDRASGANTERPGLAKALAYLRPGDTLAVWKIDRLGRSLPHLVRVVEDLRERGVGFRSLTNAGMDTTSSEGRLLFGVFAALADFERELIRERTRAALAARRAAGIRGGRRKSITPALLERARNYIEHRGLTVREAAAALKVSKSALYRALAEARTKSQA
jgi:DNA invertase Pin-like site-specific DNA recombinase